jgi:diadenosine tetraphosphate (Ap4A) HIT family hydrolase
MNELLKKFYPKYLVKEYEHWVVMFRYKQVTPGSLVIVTKTNAVEMGQLSAEAWSEFPPVCSDSERMLKKAFGAEKFNYLALMMKDPNVHFHLIPRYSQPIEVNGKIFTDGDWPLKTELKAGEYSEEDLAEIRSRLETNI